MALIDATKRPFLPVLTHLAYIRSGHVHPLEPDSKPIPRQKAREFSSYGAWGAVSTHDALRRDADGVEHYAPLARTITVIVDDDAVDLDSRNLNITIWHVSCSKETPRMTRFMVYGTDVYSIPRASTAVVMQ